MSGRKQGNYTNEFKNEVGKFAFRAEGISLSSIMDGYAAGWA